VHFFEDLVKKIMHPEPIVINVSIYNSIRNRKELSISIDCNDSKEDPLVSGFEASPVKAKERTAMCQTCCTCTVCNKSTFEISTLRSHSGLVTLLGFVFSMSERYLGRFLYASAWLQ
jgi:hypothetical protein